MEWRALRQLIVACSPTAISRFGVIMYKNSHIDSLLASTYVSGPLPYDTSSCHFHIAVGFAENELKSQNLLNSVFFATQAHIQSGK